MIIDPPSPFAPLEEWQQFLASIEKLAKDNPDDSTIAEHLVYARQMVEQKSK